jgi:alkylation response protein AidB-like acyl-CoA dehydrogenase
LRETIGIVGHGPGTIAAPVRSTPEAYLVDPRYSPEAEVFRDEVRAFLAANLPDDWRGIGLLSHDDAQRFVTEWRVVLGEHRMLAVAWPEEYGGRGLTKLEQVVLAEEFAKAGVPVGAPNDVFSVKMIGNTLLRFGTPEQRAHFLPRIVSGEDVWCQGYSEPNAGSDLASLTTRARLDGDEWVLDGQKIWTSAAMSANWIFVLARTDPDASKNRGISFLLVPLEQPGIEVRPIKMLNGLSEFNEVFFDDARTPAHHVVGEINGGWAVATALLGHERGEEAATNPIFFRNELDRLVELAREYGRLDDPHIRQRVAWCYERVEIMRYLGYRILTQYLRDGQLGPAASISKLYWSEYHQKASELAMDIMGAAGLVPTGRRAGRPVRTDEPGAPNSSASWADVFLLNARAGTVYAGTSQIQRNILGESMGLPREPRPSGA